MDRMATTAHNTVRLEAAERRPWGVLVLHGFAALVYGMVLRLCLLTMVSSIVILPLTIGLPHHLSRQAVFAQRVQVDPARDEITKEIGVPIGKPAWFVLPDPDVLLEGVSAEGARLVDDSKLRARARYPVQLGTILLLCRETQVWATAAGVAALIVFLVMRGHLDRPRRSDLARAEAIRRRLA